ncbi:MAG: zinc ABC transporter substrate-binding protein [Deltaproteobacteria bacterium]|nr:zinc ABC transporter substrate-binding protein [Deltaproteobacteria bacterium]
MKRRIKWGVFLFCLVLAACSKGESPKKTATGESIQLPISVVTTTGMIGDLAVNIGGDRVHVKALMGAGVDPHLYKATASDITKLDSADIIFYNGLNLEGKMGDIFVRISRKNPNVIAVTEEVDHARILEPPAFQGHYDPHVWFDVELWQEAAKRVLKGLEEFDAAGAQSYRKNFEVYQLKLKELHQWSLKKSSELPKEKRILVTSHDAYNYFGRAYGFQVVGLQGISTVTQAGLADIARMVDFIIQSKVKAIFIETSVSPKAIERVQADAKGRGWDVKIGGELFSDAMGAAETPEGTYVGMLKHNMSTITEHLK